MRRIERWTLRRGESKSDYYTSVEESENEEEKARRYCRPGV